LAFFLVPQSGLNEYRFVGEKKTAQSGLTMRTLGEAAGVSQSTVSKALRNDPSIPRATCERIQRLADELGYRRNPLVSALMAQLHTKRPKHQTPVIVALGLELPGKGMILTPVGEDFLKGARSRGEQLGYEVEVLKVPQGAKPDNALTRQLQFRGVSGVLVLPLPWGIHGIGWDFSVFASAALGRSLERPRIHQVSPHHSANIIGLYRAMREAGYQRIGLLLTRFQSEQVDHGWVAGFSRLQYEGETGALPVPQLKRLEAESVRRFIREHQPDALIMQETWELKRLKHELGSEFARLPVFMPGRVASEGLPGMDECAESVGEIAMDVVIGQVHANTMGVPDEPRTTLVTGKPVMQGATKMTKSKG
jgi:DNA-binding LacI/PurR family transcriptional regulator